MTACGKKKGLWFKFNFKFIFKTNNEILSSTLHAYSNAYTTGGWPKRANTNKKRKRKQRGKHHQRKKESVLKKETVKKIEEQDVYRECYGGPEGSNRNKKRKHKLKERKHK